MAAGAEQAPEQVTRHMATARTLRRDGIRMGSSRPGLGRSSVLSLPIVLSRKQQPAKKNIGPLTNYQTVDDLSMTFRVPSLKS
jgi:hypothetical protein